MWLALLCLHLVGFVGFNLLVRKSVLKKADQFALAALMQTGIAIPALVLLVLYPPDISAFSATDFAFAACGIVFTIILQISNVKSLQHLEASVFSILYNLRILLTTVLGILFLQEDTVWLRIAGGGLILVAIIIVKQKGSKSLLAKGIAWGLTAAVAVSFLNMFEKQLVSSVGFINFFPAVGVICAAIMWAFIIFRKQSFDSSILRQPNMIQLMALRALSAYAFTGALAMGALISVGNYISGMGVIFMVILGVILLDERDYLARKIAATVLAILGLTVVLISSI